MANLENNRVSATLGAVAINNILAAIKTIEAEMPFLIALTPDERQMLPKVSWDNRLFVEDTMRYIEAHPEFVPPYLITAEIRKDYDLYLQLAGFSARLNTLALVVNDTQTLAGSENFSACLAYYRIIRQASNDGIRHAQGIYDDLKRRFEGQGRPNTPPAPETVTATLPAAMPVDAGAHGGNPALPPAPAA